MIKVGAGMLLVVVAGLSGCKKPVRPNTTVPNQGPSGPLTPPNPQTTTATIHLNCHTTHAGYHDYAIDLVADHVDVCTFSVNHNVSLILENATHPDDQLEFRIDPYNGPGSYTPASLNVGTHNANESLGAGGCSDGTINVVDSAPGQPFPKPMEFVISCPNLKNSDTHDCGALNLNLRLNCSQ